MSFNLIFVFSVAVLAGQPQATQEPNQGYRRTAARQRWQDAFEARDAAACRLLAKAREEANSGNLEGAARDYEEMHRVGNFPKAEDGNLELALVYERLGRYDDARKVMRADLTPFRNGYNSDWTESKYLARYGDLCRRCGYPADAEGAYRRAVKNFWYHTDEDDYGGDFTLGWDTLQGDQLRQAAYTAAALASQGYMWKDIPYWSAKAIQIDPTSGYAYLLKANPAWAPGHIVPQGQDWLHLMAVAESQSTGDLRKSIHDMRACIWLCNGGGYLEPLPGEPTPPRKFDPKDLFKEMEKEYHRQKAERDAREKQRAGEGG